MKASHDQDDIEIDGAFNASYYDEDYVSVHNKIVYMPKNSMFINHLQKSYYEYCAMVNNTEDIDKKREFKKKNAIYSKVFTSAAAAIEIARPYEVVLGVNVTRTIYPAILDNKQAFRLTRHVVTAVNQSWKPGQIHPPGFNEVKLLPEFDYGETVFDFSCYNVVRKKIEGLLLKHPVDNDGQIDANKAKHQLQAISRLEEEQQCIVKFEDNALSFICLLYTSDAADE